MVDNDLFKLKNNQQKFSSKFADLALRDPLYDITNSNFELSASRN